MNIDELYPPDELSAYVGGGDFKGIGGKFLHFFTELAGLEPNERVLDVGCGIGRMAIPLTQFLDKNGGYEGFDIVARSIDWCRDEITSRYPNFRFQLADVFNKVYNPHGRYKASEYVFPYDDESFDFIFLTSVFTHLLPEDMENYFSEVARVLKKNGRCLTTFFLLNRETLKLMKAGKAMFDFKHQSGVCGFVDADTPEAVVGYAEPFVLALYEQHGLKINEPIQYGQWCGRDKYLDGQDIIIATKKGKHSRAAQIKTRGKAPRGGRKR
jgi:SAM-dependent methyltransferase